MLPKKLPSADLEQFRGLFFKVGLIISLLIVLIAVEWSGNESTAKGVYSLADAAIDVEYLPLVTETKKEIPKPKLQNFQIIKFNEETDKEDYEPIDNGIDENVAVAFVLPVNKQEETDPIISFPAVDPEFPGGIENLKKFISRNLKYPQAAIDNHLEGKVFVRFTIDKKGEVKNAEVIRSIDSSLDKEALRVVALMPKWRPGMTNGKPLNVSYTLPVTFRLQ
jgi:protein TonB